MSWQDMEVKVSFKEVADAVDECLFGKEDIFRGKTTVFYHQKIQEALRQLFQKKMDQYNAGQEKQFLGKEV